MQKTNRIIGHIESALKAGIQTEIFRHPRDDYHKNVHVSDLVNFCGRKYYLIRNAKLGVAKKAGTTGEGVTYRIGRDLQDFVTRSLSDVLVGRWVCKQCRTPIVGMYADKCDNCGISRHKEYREFQLAIPAGPFEIRGGIDLIIYDKIMKEGYSIEVKSIKHESFKELTEPVLSHQYQEGFYLKMIDMTKKEGTGEAAHLLKKYNIRSDMGIVLYVSKGSGFQHPFKIFPLQRKAVPRLDVMMTSAIKELKTFSKKKAAPKRLCSTKHHLLAKECAICEYCFSVDN